MSKERARRRAEREAERARQEAARAERDARLARRRERRDRLVAVLPSVLPSVLPGRVRVARQGGIMARRQRAQNAVVVVLFVIVQVLAWLLLSGWAARLGVLVLSLLLLPVLVTLVFDRRS